MRLFPGLPLKAILANRRRGGVCHGSDLHRLFASSTIDSIYRRRLEADMKREMIERGRYREIYRGRLTARRWDSTLDRVLVEIEALVGTIGDHCSNRGPS
jgi:hypothetical protein